MVIPFGGEFESSSSIAADKQVARAVRLGFESAALYRKTALETQCASSRFDDYFSRPAGGQFSSFMPRVRPREARTSLISLSDLRPRLGVLSSSFSVRWIRSPM